MPKPLRFTFEDAERAWEEWGANCGPGAIAAVCGLTLDELRPQLGDFERKKYTNPTLMREVLKRLGVEFKTRTRRGEISPEWPAYGLARIQWEGPWTKPGVPIAARYRHTHWVGAAQAENGERGVFDINCMNAGGWVSLEDWAKTIAPYLIKHHAPRGDGKWYLTHAVEVLF